MMQTSPVPSRRRLVDQSNAILAAGLGAAAAAGVAASSGNPGAVGLLALPALFIILRGLQLAPAAYWFVWLAGLAFLPLTGVVEVGPAPALVMGMGLSLLGLAASTRSRWSRADRSINGPELLVIALFTYTALILAMRGELSYLASPVLMLWALPVLFGSLAMRHLGPRRVASGLVGSALALTPLLLIERVTGVNVITALFPDSGNFERGTGVAVMRFDLTRVQAGWSHPILLSLFLATTVVLAFALAVEAESRWGRFRWSAAAITLAAACTLCISRSSVLLLGFALGFVLVCAVLDPGRRSASARGGSSLALLIAAGVAAIIAVSPLGRSILSPDSSELASSTGYRDTLLAYVLGNDLIAAGPNRYPDLVSGPNYFSIDNMYLLLGMQLGWIFVLLLTAAVLSLAVLSLRPSSSRWSRWYAGALLGLFAAHWYVASFGKEQMFLWMMIGLVLGLLSAKGPETGPAATLRHRD